MSFDPEKVERWVYVGYSGMDKACQQDGNDVYVSASDYDQLLQLYRREKVRADAFAEALQGQVKLDKIRGLSLHEIR